MASAATASKKSSSSSTAKKSNQNYSTNLAGGGSVSVTNGVKTYSDALNKVTGKGGISISGESYSRNKGGTGFAPNNVITPASTAVTPSISLPTPTQTVAPDVTAMNTGLAGGETGVTNTNGILTVDPITQQALDSGRTNFQTMLDSINNANEERTTGADIQRKLEKESGLKQYRQSVNDYTSQINNIVANRDATVLSLEGQGRGITEGIIGGQQAQVNKEAAIKALPIQALLANAQGNLDTANQYINTWGSILMNDANNAYNNKVKTIEAVYNFASSQDKLKLDSLQAQQKEKKDAAIALATAKTNAIKQALSQPGGNAVVQAITMATDENGVVTALGKFNGDVLGNQIRQAQLNQLNTPEVVPMTPVQISEVIQQSVSDSNPTTVKSSLAALLGSPIIGAATKARISPSLAVLNSVDELANGNVEGKFTGIGVAGRLKEAVKGLFGYKNPEAITNAQNIEAINLKVQQWASGASLTEQQIKQVDRFTPKLTDRDTTVKTKLNGLYNFMLNQAESDLLTEGVNVQFPAVNLFEISDLYAKASPEQRTLIEQTYFNK